jgi:hypothetical protein
MAAVTTTRGSASVKMTAHQNGGIFVRELRKRTQRGRSNIDVLVLHHALHEC